MSDFRIYHGAPSPAKLEKCREAAPSYEHGVEWLPAKMTPHDEPWILDNGAFGAYINGEPWDVDAFVRRLTQIDDRMPRDPDFVVLPDVVTDADATVKRAGPWADLIDQPTAYPVQDGMAPEATVERAVALGCVALFIGGTWEFKQAHADEFAERAHENGLLCHIGRPENIGWAESTGADSCDTTTIVRNDYYHKLRQLEEQQTLSSGVVA